MSDTQLVAEAQRRRTFAVISHPDAGKSTLTEALALHARAITEAGAIHGKAGRRSTVSDWMEMEKARGISITSTALQFPYRDCVINLLDTPGHADFSEDTYRVLSAVDCAVMLIDAAKGRYALFLDDDDWLLPDHLKKLVEALDASPDCVAAYADVQMMKVQGDCMEGAHLFASEFDPLRLQFENYLPIHSVLFRRTAVDALPACRFGTELELFEDWDFWIQLAQKGSFQRLPGVSAVYALSVDAGSGHTRTDSELRQRMLEQLATRQLSRWTPRQVSDLMGMVAESQRLQQLSKAQIAATREESRMLLRQSTAQQNEIRKLEQLRLQHLQQISDLNDQLISTYRSRSWRITRPLRAVSRAMRWVKAGNAWRLLQRLPQALMVELRRHGWLGFLSRVPFYVRN